MYININFFFFEQGFEHLVVITGTQCFVYNIQNFNTAIIFNFVGGISLLTLAGTNG